MTKPGPVTAEPSLESFLRSRQPVPLIQIVDARHLDQIRAVLARGEALGWSTVQKFLRAVDYRCSEKSIKQLLEDLRAER